MSEEYEVGGRVKISGKWFKIGAFASRSSRKLDSIGLKNDCTGWTDIRELTQFIEDYEPPKKEVAHEWLPWVQVPIHLHYGDSISSQSVQDMAKSINKLLTNWYGAPPIVRTYNGESAEEFGLEDCSYISYWNEDAWDAGSFRILNVGDKWMPQPPAPKEDA